MEAGYQIDAAWNELDDEERDAWLEVARENANHENAELRKLGYDKDSDQWISREQVLENAKELAYEQSPQGVPWPRPAVVPSTTNARPAVAGP